MGLIEILKDQFPSLCEALERCCKDIVSDETAFKEEETSFVRIYTDIDAPLSYMIYVTLVLILNFPYFGKEEKVAWTIPYTYKGMRFYVSHRKFGIRFFAHEECSPDLAKEMLIKLSKAIKITDKLIEPLITAQVQKGNIAITNKYHSFYDRYEYFRDKAKEAFNSSPPPPTPLRDNTGKVIGSSSSPFQPIREGFFNTQAMLDAFFSYLEHILILLVPFQGDVNIDNLVTLMSADWTQKYNAIFKPQVNSVMMKHYGKLHQIKERFRNTFAHGGFEKQSSSLFVQIPHLGYIPITLSKHRDSVHFSMFPIEVSTYEAICKIIDDFENELNKSYRGMMEILRSGLDIYYDDQSVFEYNEALKSEEALIEYLNYQSELYSRNANMDW